MIRTIAISLWALCLMAGAIYYSAVLQGGGAANAAEDRDLETYDLEMSSFPVVRENQIRGYIIVSALFSVISENSRKLSLPLEYVIKDALLETILADRDIDIFQIEKVDLAKLKSEMIANVNANGELVSDIKFKSLDYLSKNEIRDMKLRRY